MRLCLLLPLVLALPAFAGDEIERARAACERDVTACRRLPELEAAARAEEDRRFEQERAAREAEAAAARARAAAEAEAAQQREAALRRTCGADFGRVRVGMTWKRASQCAGEFSLVAEDERGAVYEAAGGLVRVVRWIAK